MSSPSTISLTPSLIHPSAEVSPLACIGEGSRKPRVPPGAEQVLHQYTLCLAARDAVIPRLAAEGIGYGIHYPTPIHQQPAYSRLGYRDHLPQAEAACREVLLVPVHPALSQADLETIVAALSQA